MTNSSSTNQPNNKKSHIRLGIWGSSGAGKTTYMTMLYQALKKTPRWRIQPANDEAQDFIQNNIRKIHNGEFPHRTQVDENEGGLKIYGYRLVKNGAEENSITLNFIDAPGEYYEDYTKTLEVKDPDSAKSDIIDYLLSCDGIVFLLDPDPEEENQGKAAYSTMLTNLFFAFSKRHRKANKVNNERLEQYIAFCITKVDHDKLFAKALKIDSAEYVKNLISPHMTLEELSNDIWIELDKEERKKKTQYNRCEFFYTSALGRYKGEDGISRTPFIPNQSTQPPNNPGQNEGNYYGYDSYNEPNSNNNSNSEDDNWGSINNPRQNSGGSQHKKVVGGKINPTVPLQPIGVLEPVEWLIERIQAYPPIPFKANTTLNG